MTDEKTIRELKARVEAQSRKIRALEKEIEKIKRHLSQKKLNRWLV